MSGEPTPETQAGHMDVVPFDCQSELVELFELLVNVMFCMKNRDGRYVAVNGAFVRRTGRASKRDVVGRRATELFSAPLAERYEQQDTQVLTTGRPLRDELELIRREDGTLGWYLTVKLPVVDRHADHSSEASAPVGLVSVSRDLRTPGDDQSIESLGRVVAHVRDHMGSRIRVADLAAVADCSPAQLERRMRRTFGLSATKYVLRARVDRATELLVGTDRPLSEIAHTVGFYDQADFTHRFARLTNETPAQFRASHR
ncbi:MAG: AraC family transcriptional regulator [Actinomycetota bacterium]